MLSPMLPMGLVAERMGGEGRPMQAQILGHPESESVIILFRNFRGRLDLKR